MKKGNVGCVLIYKKGKLEEICKENKKLHKKPQNYNL